MKRLPKRPGAKHAPQPQPATPPVPPRFVVHVDGAIGPDAGQKGAGLGVVVRDGMGRVCLLRKGWVPGPITNNEAEYAALLLALQILIPLAPCEVTLMSDSRNMVNQLRGLARVRSPTLQPLHAEACRLMSHFPQIQITFVPREHNRLADALAWEAADGWREASQNTD